MYVTLRGEVEIRSLGFKERMVKWDSFGAGRANQSYLLYLPSKPATSHTQTLAAIPKRTMEKIEMRPSKLKLVPLSVILALLTILPVYFVYIIDYLPDNPTLKITCLPVSIFLGYNTYRLIKRLFIGPIITLTADSIILRDNDK